MAKPNLRLVTPTTENRTVTPQRPPNRELRTREHLTADEVEKPIDAPSRTAMAIATRLWCSWPTGTASERPKWLTYAGAS
jgi:hypothetical protein